VRPYAVFRQARKGVQMSDARARGNPYLAELRTEGSGADNEEIKNVRLANMEAEDLSIPELEKMIDKCKNSQNEIQKSKLAVYQAELDSRLRNPVGDFRI